MSHHCLAMKAMSFFIKTQNLFSSKVYISIEVVPIIRKFGIITEIAFILFLFTLILFSLGAQANNTNLGERYIPPKIDPPKISIHDSRFLNIIPQNAKDLYTVNEKDIIIEGPRYNSNEPIDYYWLLSDKFIAKSFSNALFSDENIPPDRAGLEQSAEGRYVPQGAVRIQKPVQINFSIDPSNFRNHNKDAMNLSIEKLIKTSGLDIALESQSNKNVFYINILAMIDKNDVASAIEILKREIIRRKSLGNRNKNIINVLQTLDFIYRDEQKRCFFIPFFQGKTGEYISADIYSYGDKRFVGKCLIEEIFQVIGLFKDNDTAFSSIMTDTYKIYSHPTKLDYALIEILYKADLSKLTSKKAALNEALRVLQQQD